MTGIHVVAVLRRIGQLPVNWDGEGSSAPALSVRSIARRLLRWGLDQTSGQPPFAIAPLPGGGILLDWRCGSADVEVHIGPSGDLGYLFIDRTGSERRFDEADNVSEAHIRELLLRAFDAK